MSIAGTAVPVPTEFPSPREGLDTGSIAELVQDCQEIRLDLPATAVPVHHHVDLVVPDDASALILGFEDYGC